jgi:hypothetical protein
MSPDPLSPDQVRALARMARGGIRLDRDGRGVFAGRAIIDRGTVSSLAEADLIDLDRPAGVPRLTIAGRTALTRVRG